METITLCATIRALPVSPGHEPARGHEGHTGLNALAHMYQPDTARVRELRLDFPWALEPPRPPAAAAAPPPAAAARADRLAAGAEMGR